MIAIGIIVIILILYILSTYNKIVKLLNIVKQSESGIDIYLKQRFELIPNLVECVKGYTNYEKTTLEDITKMRTEYMNNSSLKKAEKLNKEINSILAIAEKYPELKASEQYLKLQESLIKIESQLQAARRIYNNDVTKYNTTIGVVPKNFVAKLFGFKKADVFQIEEYKRNNVNIENEIKDEK